MPLFVAMTHINFSIFLCSFNLFFHFIFTLLPLLFTFLDFFTSNVVSVISLVHKENHSVFSMCHEIKTKRNEVTFKRSMENCNTLSFGQ